VLLPPVLLEMSQSCFKKNGNFDSGKSGVEARVLFEKLSSLQNKLYKSKQLPKVSTLRIPSNGSFASLVGSLDEKVHGDGICEMSQDCVLTDLHAALMSAACTSTSPKLLPLYKNAVCYLLKLNQRDSLNTLTTTVFAKSCEPALEDWICKRRGKINTLFFEGLLADNPEYGWALVPTICKYSMEDASSNFHRCEALRTVSFALRRVPSKKVLKKSLKYIWKAVASAVEAASDFEKNGSWKAPRLRVVIQLCNDLVRASKKEDLSHKCPENGVGASIRDIMTPTQFRALKIRANLFLNSQGEEEIPVSRKRSNSTRSLEKKSDKSLENGNVKKKPKHAPVRAVEAGKNEKQESKTTVESKSKTKKARKKQKKQKD